MDVVTFKAAADRTEIISVDKLVELHRMASRISGGGDVYEGDHEELSRVYHKYATYRGQSWSSNESAKTLADSVVKWSEKFILSLLHTH